MAIRHYRNYEGATPAIQAAAGENLLSVTGDFADGEVIVEVSPDHGKSWANAGVLTQPAVRPVAATSRRWLYRLRIGRDMKLRVGLDGLTPGGAEPDRRVIPDPSPEPIIVGTVGVVDPHGYFAESVFTWDGTWSATIEQGTFGFQFFSPAPGLAPEWVFLVPDPMWGSSMRYATDGNAEGPWTASWGEGWQVYYVAP